MSRLFDDGSTEYLYTDTTPITAYPVSVSAWFNTDSNALNQCIISIVDKDVALEQLVTLKCRGDVAGDPLRIFVIDPAPQFGSATTATGYSVNTWHQAGGVFASTTSRAVYIDGGSKDTDTDLSTPDDIDRIAIGVTGDSTPTDYFSGMIAEVGVWNVALTDAEMAILAEGYSPLFVRLQNLVAYWPLIRGLNDRVGGYNLTANGTLVAAHPRIIYPAAPHIPLHIIGVPAVVTNIAKIAAHNYRMRRLNNM